MRGIRERGREGEGEGRKDRGRERGREGGREGEGGRERREGEGERIIPPIFLFADDLIEEIRRDISTARERQEQPAMAELAQQLSIWTPSKH